MCVSLFGIEGFICVVEVGDVLNIYDVFIKSLLKYYVKKIIIIMKFGLQVYESQVNILGFIGQYIGILGMLEFLRFFNKKKNNK